MKLTCITPLPEHQRKLTGPPISRERPSRESVRGTDVATKEHPIIFTPENVRKILNGHKTQTRRVIILPKDSSLGVWEPTKLGGYLDKACTTLAPQSVAIFHTRSGRCIGCPFGQVGDRLWVRETWYCDHVDVQKGPFKEVDGAKELLYYRSTDSTSYGKETYTRFSGETMRNPWFPSIHMPRWASRLTLKITEIRVERVRDISEKDAEAEGIIFIEPGRAIRLPMAEQFGISWNRINAKRGYGWDKNPWV